MPTLTLKHCTIADVQMDEQDTSKRVVKIFINEEDFFEMLDHVNPKNIIKYLDMRKIAHRDALQINVKTIDGCLPDKTAKNKRNRAIKGLYEAASRANHKLTRAKEMVEQYGGKAEIRDMA